MALVRLISPHAAILATKFESHTGCRRSPAISAFVLQRPQFQIGPKRDPADVEFFRGRTSTKSLGIRMGAVKPTTAQNAEPAENAKVLPELMTEFMVDMKCDGCVKNVLGKLEPVEGVSQVEVDLDHQVVRVTASTPLKDLMAALEATGRKNRLIGQGTPRDMELTAAVAEFKGPSVFGVVRFAQVSQELTRIEAQFDGLTPGAHGWSINTYGDLTNGPASTGGHYNPSNLAHAAPSSEIRHVGDLGNVTANEEGHAEYSGTIDRIKVWDLIGRAVVLCKHEDELGRGSQTGVGLAAAVIARSAGVGQNYKNLCTCDGSVIWEATPNDYVAAK